ncbi:hypothetical protein CHS0354_007032, partial [Potamilus streckersoni]
LLLSVTRHVLRAPPGFYGEVETGSKMGFPCGLIFVAPLMPSRVLLGERTLPHWLKYLVSTAYGSD